MSSQQVERRVLGETVLHPTLGPAVAALLQPGEAAPLPQGASSEVPEGAVVEAILPGGGGPARVLAVLAPPGSAKAALYRLLPRFQLSPLFPPEVDAEVEAILKNPGVDDAALRDLTSLPFVTIDNEDSRDLDQAMFLRRLDGGRVEVLYALADAAYYVRPGTALFAEALRRGTSFYLPRLSVPMLPRALSEGIISLNPQVDRRALVLATTLDASGQLLGTEVLRARIRSQAKLSYSGVQRWHDDPASSPLSGQPWTETLELLREVGLLRIQAARERDVVSYERRYIDIDYGDAQGFTFVATGASRFEVERWNEQLSLLCNMEGARLLTEAAGLPYVQPIFRVHPAPSPASLRALREGIEALVHARGLDPAVWCWRPRAEYGADGESLAAYIERLPAADPDTERVRRTIESQAMISAEASTFSADVGPHWGVGAPGYVRLSAPMREIVGVFTHKELLERLGRPEDAANNADDEQLRLRVVEAANRARSVQRQLTKAANKLVIDQLLQREAEAPLEARPWRLATVMGIKPTRLYLQLDEPPIEIKLYAETLDGTWAATPDRTCFTDGARRFVLGDAARVRVRAYDAARERWSFELDEAPPPAP